MNRIGTYLLTICTLVVILGCQKTPEKQLVGKWAEVNGADRIEFKSDGSFAGNMAYGMGGQQKDIVGKYFIEGEAISINLYDSYPMTWKFKFSGEELVITYEKGGAVKMDGAMAKFSRVK